MCFVLFLTILINGQTRSDEKIKAEIISLRTKTVEAIEKRDRKLLEEIYARDFTHTHASGKVDDRETRLNVYLSGEKTIDTVPAEDLKIKIFGKNTAVASGKSAIKNEDGTVSVYRWIIVYARIGKKWQVVASQATKFSE